MKLGVSMLIRTACLAILLFVHATAFAQSTECPSGDPLNCHPGFEGCLPGLPPTSHPLVIPGGGSFPGYADGRVELLNDHAGLHIAVSAPLTNYQITSVYVHAAPTLAQVPLAYSAYDTALPVPAPYRGNLDLVVPMFPANCGVVSVVVELVHISLFGAINGTATAQIVGTPVPGGNAQAATYCTSCCNVAPGSYHTEIPTTWGSPLSTCNGDFQLPAYLETSFATIFPNDLTIGCSNHSATFTSAAAVRSYLYPGSGGSAVPLTQSFTNPTQAQLPNTLAKEVVALTLNVAVDIADQQFSQTPHLLKDLVLPNGVYGTFAGWTVEQVLAEANNYLGGCGMSASYTVGRLLQAVRSINQNFRGGSTAGTFLACPTDPEGSN